MQALNDARREEREAEMHGDKVAADNARKAAEAAEEEKSTLDLFRKDLGSFVRFYEFISQVIDLADPDLEKLAVYARHLQARLRPEVPDDDLDLSGVDLTHYRLQKQGEHQINLREGEGDYRLTGGIETGTGTAREPEKESLAEIIARLNELFAGEGLTDQDRLNYLYTMRDKVLENEAVKAQIEANDSADQILLGDFSDATQNAVIESLNAHRSQAETILRDRDAFDSFTRLLLDVILRERTGQRTPKSL